MNVDSPLILAREQVRRVDRIAIERFGVPGIVLMENAARGVVDAIAAERLSHRKVLVLCGGGNNGGDGLAIARLLHNAGGVTQVAVMTDPSRYAGDALINWRIAVAMRSRDFTIAERPAVERIESAIEMNGTDLIVDALFGTGLTSPPRPPFAELAEVVNRSGIPVVAVDLPSGLDCDTGEPIDGVSIRAALTVTFVGLKKGFANPASAAFTGKVIVADIGCPRAAIEAALGPLSPGEN